MTTDHTIRATCLTCGDTLHGDTERDGVEWARDHLVHSHRHSRQTITTGRWRRAAIAALLAVGLSGCTLHQVTAAMSAVTPTVPTPALPAGVTVGVITPDGYCLETGPAEAKLPGFTVAPACIGHAGLLASTVPGTGR